MSINSAPIYDWAAWIELAPEFDWDDLATVGLIEVTAAAPTFDNTADTYTIPAAEGVQYLVDGVVTAAGTVSVGAVDATVVVTAEALEGYALTGTASWTGTFTAAPGE